MNIAWVVDAGSVWPELCIVEFSAKLLTTVVPVFIYVPVRYTFDDVAATDKPWHTPGPDKFVKESALPDGAYFMIKAPVADAAGSVNPELWGVELSAKLLTVDVPEFV